MWHEAVQTAYQRLLELRRKEQQRLDMLRQREVIDILFKKNEIRSAEKIQQAFRQYRFRKQARLDLQRREEARKRREQAQARLDEVRTCD